MLRWKLSTADERRAWREAAARAIRDLVATHQNASKPTHDEDVRRLKVMAEAAVREKRFGDASEAYLDAARLAPGVPEFHFNAALMLAETRWYPEAIEQIQEYLALVPNAPDARSAQDKVYEWQGKRK
jgi:tetratricopeptide (TPR) repeat protein